jgi:polyvinyl alcohol dehydrogenase (cytochrome)
MMEAVMNISNRAVRSLALAARTTLATARSAVRRRATAAGAGLGVLTVLAAPTPVASASSFVNWPSYLDGVTHHSYTTQAKAITPSNAASLAEAWHFMPGAPPVKSLGYALNASPTVYDGVVYIGGNNGTFYAINESTGAVVWQRAIGYVDPKEGTCGARGITSTATVAPDPTTKVPTVYVSSGSGYLYAMDAATGTVTWKSVIHLPVGETPNYYDWSSPTVVNQKIYIGVSGTCTVHVRGALDAFSQATGKKLATYYTVPSGQVGGSIWSTAAVASDGNVFVGTGNVTPPTPPNEGTSESIVELSGTNLHQLGVWQLPLAEQPSDDSDFGASVSLFSAVLPGTTKPTAMVGACNKNGIYYALKQNELAAGPVWQTRIAVVNIRDDGMGSACLSSTVVNGTDLYVAGTATTIGGTSYPGSIDELNAATGTIVWATGLPSRVLGTPSLDGAGVLAVGTYRDGTDPEADYLLDPSTGTILATISNGDSSQFAQPVFAGQYLFIATETAGLYAYQPPLQVPGAPVCPAPTQGIRAVARPSPGEGETQARAPCAGLSLAIYER